ncbi:hypothetical protein P8452_48039 [Trifolium repens]|nr:hypothetical protein P8452_48039 [Trifolium repens]
MLICLQDMRGKGKGDMVIMVGHSCWCYLKHEYDMSGFNHSSSSDIAAENLRDLSQSIDVPLLDATVAAFYCTGSKQERSASILRDLQNNPDMWFKLCISCRILKNDLTETLEFSCKSFFDLCGMIKMYDLRWSIRNAIYLKACYHAKAAVDLWYDQDVLEGLIKYRWNALPAEQRDGMNSEFQLIHELWLYVLSASQRAELILATPSTIHVFLSWIPLGFIFESPLLETLLKFIPVPAYRNLTLQCLTEVASIQFGRFYDVQYVKMYGICMGQLQCRAYSRLPQIYRRHMQMITLYWPFVGTAVADYVRKTHHIGQYLLYRRGQNPSLISPMADIR